MTQALAECGTQSGIAELQAGFLALLPRLETHAKFYFRHIACSDKRSDKIAESVGLAWKLYRRLDERGKNVASFQKTFVFLVAKAVKCGRRLCGQEKARDAFCSRTQQRYRFTINSFTAGSGLNNNVFCEALQDNTQTPIPEQVSFRCDFPAWQQTRTERDRRLADDLMLGERTLDVSNKYGLTPARISQLRGEFHEDWIRFTGDRAKATSKVTTN